jgi:signal peptidase I
MDLRDVKEFCIDTSKYIITIFVVIFLIVYVVTVQQVVGSSMSPNFENKDILILNKIHYRFFDIKRFDVVSLEYDDTKYLIKRVIGMPGDKVEYKDNILYVNDEVVEEKFLDDNIVTDDFSITDLGYEVIPKGKYLVLGDNRGDSLDSRDIGLIDEKTILGKINLRIWPINKIRFVK